MSVKNKKMSERDRKLKRRQRITAIIAIILIAVMVLGLMVVAVNADTGDTMTSSSSSSASVTAGNDASTDGSTAGTAGTDASQTGTAQTVSTSSGTSDAAAQGAENSAGESVTGSSTVSSSVTSGSGSTADGKKADVYINDINVTGMSETEIQDAVNNLMTELSGDTIALYAGEKCVRVTAGDLGLSYSNTYVAEEAYSVGKKGNIFKRFLADRQLSENKPIIFCLDLTVSEDKVRTVLNQYLDNFNCEPKSNGLHLNDDYTFTLEKGSDGVSVNVDASVTKIVDYMENEWNGGEGGVTLDAVITPYEDTTDDLSSIQDLLGTATTEYDTSDPDHATNIELAAQHIDGSVVYPGEEFSTDDAIGPTTEENGFRPGASYSGSQIVETFGGGICQVSTTLYDAVLGAELEVTEHHNHSHLISYVQPGFDASITNDSDVIWDMKFVNNTSEPIYIQGVAGNGTLTFNIYGKEYRPSNRTVEYVNETGDYEDTETQFLMSSSYPLGYISSSGGIGGVTASLYKVVYVDGQEESRDLVTTSVYRMMPLTYTIGISDAYAATVANITTAIGSGDLNSVRSAVLNGSTTNTGY